MIRGLLSCRQNECNLIHTQTGLYSLYQDGQQFFNRAIILLEKSQALFSDNDKKYLTKVIEMKKDLDLKRDPSEIDMNVKEMLSEIKNSVNC